jgi:hypothetical protein
MNARNNLALTYAFTGGHRLLLSELTGLVARRSAMGRFGRFENPTTIGAGTVTKADRRRSLIVNTSDLGGVTGEMARCEKELHQFLLAEGPAQFGKSEERN